jgi:hypothetical protein
MRKRAHASPVHSNYPVNWLLMFSDLKWRASATPEGVTFQIRATVDYRWRPMTWAEHQVAVGRMARGLVGRGPHPGARVGILAPTRIRLETGRGPTWSRSGAGDRGDGRARDPEGPPAGLKNRVLGGRPAWSKGFLPDPFPAPMPGWGAATLRAPGPRRRSRVECQSGPISAECR